MRLIAGLCLTFLCGVCCAGHLGYLYPGGARAGETVDILAGGQNNWGCRTVYVEGGGVRCIKVDPAANVPFLFATQREYAKKAVRCLREHKPRPPLPEKRDDWRKCVWLDRLETLTPLQMDIFLRGIYTRPNPLQISPSIAQKTIITLEIDPDAKPGVRYLRLMGNGVLSNPVPFFVGKAPEYKEPGFTPPYEKPVVQEVTLPASLNGQVLPGETDIFRVRMEKGKPYYFKLFGRFFKPYVGDGVPGFFQPVIELCDEKGVQVAIADRDGLEADPLMVCRVPSDGVYLLKIRDALYRGREDFVYRVECGTGEYPRPPRPAAELPDLPRREWLPGMAAESPVLVTGELAPGERRTVRIPGKKGEVKVFQTLARKIGSDIDPVLRFFGPDGKLVAENDDDTPEVLLGRGMHFADAFLMVTLPADGEYILELAESAGKPGKYLLRIDRPRPDFELVVAPSGIETFLMGIAPAEVLVRRKEGFTGPIRLSVADAANLLLCGNTEIPPGVTKTPVTFRVVTLRRNQPPAPFRLLGTAKLPDGTKIVRSAVAADPAMQAFAYTHYVDAPRLLWFARWKGPVTIWDKQVVPYKIAGKPGATVKYTLPLGGLPPDVEFGPAELVDAPAWLEVSEVRLMDHYAKRRTGVLVVKFKFRPDAPPGTVHVLQVKVPYKFTVKNKDNQTRVSRNDISLPALRIEVERTRP